MRKGVVVALALAFALLSEIAAAQEKPTPRAKKAAAGAPKHVVMAESDLKWEDAPPSLPPGAKSALLHGDPGKPGMFALRVKLPSGYKIAAHWHPTAEYLTVLSGSLYVGTGDKLDESKGTELKAGGYASMPARMHHFAWSKGETVFELNSTGPFKITYVNAADDPRKATKK